MTTTINNKVMQTEEIELKAMNGMACLIMNILAVLASIAAFIIGILMIEGTIATTSQSAQGLAIALIIIGSVYGFIVGPLLFIGLKVIKPNEAMVMTLFGKYIGTLKGAGFYWVNPFCIAVNPAAGVTTTTSASVKPAADPVASALTSMNSLNLVNKKISLKDNTLNNDRLKINDQLGNPIIIGIVVIWRVVNTARAAFNVENYKEFLSIQCDSALRNIVRLYPYDNPGNDNEHSLRGSSQEIAEELRTEIQAKVENAGLEIVEARITHLSYAEEIAAVMLQRQQASAIVDAKNMIVEGAVGMVEMALAKLSENDIVHLDEERKAAMVSNLLVILCGNKETQPVVNTGSLY
ncbi:MAG: SPFH domain-containing protein [Oscillospiraceae bacterium]|nr:SPFH domain-containing protein [Oscillospiraceae bacterium]